MINLLPPDAKTEIRAGRVNRLLVRYMILFVILMMVLFVQLGFAYYSLNVTKTQADQRTSSSLSSASEFTSRQKEVTQFTSDLGVAKQILNKQTNYSTIILRVASVIPQGVVIDQLSLDSTTFGKPTTITAHAKNDAAALALKTAMSNSPYFQAPHFSTFSAASNPAYPITITMDVTFTKELLK